MRKYNVPKAPALQDTPFAVAILQATMEDLLDRIAKLELRVIQLEQRGKQLK